MKTSQFVATLAGEDHLADAVDLLAADTPGGGLVYVRGATGSGRSRMVADLADRLRVLGKPVVCCGHDEADGELPVIGRLLQYLLTQGTRPGLTRALTAVPQIYQLALRDPDAYQVALAHELTAAVRALGPARTPRLLIDDLDRADPRTLSLLCLLVDQLRAVGARLLLVSDESATGTVADLAATADLVLTPAGLTAPEIGRLLAQRLNCRTDDDLVQAVTDALGPAHSLPGVVLALIDQVIADGRIAVVDDHAQLIDPETPLVLPDGHRLYGSARGPASAALGVLGWFKRCDLAVVAEVCGVEPAPLHQVVSELHDLGVLDNHEHELRFAVPAVRQGLTRAADPQLRRAVHAAVAKVRLAELADGRDVDEYRLADHLAEAADLAGGVEVADQLLSTARRALLTEPGRAIGWCLAAFDMLDPDNPAWLDVLDALPPILCHHGWFAEAAELLTRVLPLMPPQEGELRTRVLLVWRSLALVHDNRVRELVRTTADTVARLDRLGVPSAGPRFNVAMHTEDFAEAHRLITELQWASPIREYRETAQLSALWYHGVAGSGESFAEMWRKCLDNAEYTDVERPDPEDVREAVSTGDLSRLRDLWSGTVHGRSERCVLRRYQIVQALFVSGEWDEALRQARRCRVEPEPDGAWVPSLVRALAAEIHARRGDLRRAQDWLATADDTVLFGHIVSWARCGTLRFAGKNAQALEVGENAYRRARSLGYVGGLEPLLGRVIDMAAAEKDEARLKVWRDEAERLHARLASRESGILLLRASAVLSGDVTAAAELLRLARALGRTPVLASATLIAGRLGIEPEQLLRESHELHRVLKAPPGRAAAAAALKERGLPVPRNRQARSELSVVELDLVRLVAEGKTNRQIAAVLGVSEKTVESYLTQLFTKTGCRTRVELTAAHADGRLNGRAGGRNH
nr:LuxR C-terminal-related transcriptional regulator [Kibdelosporangium sp. MJ126-NF4]CEL16299.1 regulatory protein, LuxR [Kibdelosporangium sp. MJ126-NF4]CTQ94222.1 regulatory protein, LuxR [Kibdelosporangium sp. MJ126-NF4]